MLFSQFISRTMASFAIFALVTVSLPAKAEISANVNQNSVLSSQSDEPTLIAQAGTAAEVADIAAVGSVVTKKQKYELLITDSLWGNLILDMAYQRDDQLRKIYKKFALVNMGTMAAVAGIAGGTLAQGVIALATLNPSQGNDTYLPGAIGIGMSTLTIATFVGRAAVNHHLAKCLRNRQLEIKHQVEAVLAQLEKENGVTSASKNELIALIGERATNEWLQLWTSSNAVASLKVPSVSSLKFSSLIAEHNQ
jgi:hypothetical protein